MNNTLPLKKQRLKRSQIWKLSLESLKEIVKNSNTIVDILRHFGLTNKGANYRTLIRRMREENIDFSHIPLGKGASKGKTFPNAKKIPLEEILIENSSYGRGSLKKRLFKNNLLKNECYICGQQPFHNNKVLSLQLDHINGVSDDNRLENLRILCPNCHSQTDTFAGKRHKLDIPKKYRRTIKNTDGTDKLINIKPSVINPEWRNAPRPTTRKVERPSKEVLEKLLWEKPTLQIAKDFGVSDKAVEKWAKTYNLNKPSRGYWAKLLSK